MYGLIYPVGEIVKRDIIKKSFCFAFYSSATTNRASAVQRARGERSEIRQPAPARGLWRRSQTAERRGKSAGRGPWVTGPGNLWG